MAYVCSTTTRAVRLVSQFSFVLAALVGAASVASAQTTVTLSTPGPHVNVDTTIRGGGYATVDSSTDAILVTKASSDSYTRRTLLKFDTENYVPKNAVIQSAKLYLVLQQADGSAQRPLTAFRVTKSFLNRQTTWHSYRDGLTWTNAGGDLGERFTTTYVGASVGSTYTFDLTQLVQRSVNGEFGSRYTRVALVDTGGSSSDGYRAFHSTRAGNASVRPRLVITYGSGSTTSVSSPATTTSTGTTLRVMQWNIKNAQGNDGVCSPDRIASTVVKHDVHVVSMNEVKYFAGKCAWTFDMSARLEALLEQKTGVEWYRKFVNVYGNTDRGYGNVLLSRYRPTSSSTKLLSYERGVAQVTLVVNGRNVNLFSTHVEYYTAWWRPIQIKEALAWVSTFSAPRILMGDFNTNPGTSEYNLLANTYPDAWAMAKKAGTATAFNGTGATHGSSRFDYVFYSSVSSLVLRSVQVPDTRINGVFPSDHHPVIAEFKVQ